MGLTDLFRPRHRHSDAAIRADAVRLLGSEEAELVASIARDDRDPSVRRIAIDKIEDPDVLVDLADAEPERTLRERAHCRAADLWVRRAVATEEPTLGHEAVAGLVRMGDQRAIAEVASRAELDEIRDAAMAKLDDSRALADLARNPNTHTKARSTAIERIDDPEVLRSIAVDEKRREVALAVLERLEDPEVLEAVASKAKNKAVRQRARKKLAEQNKSAPAREGVSPEAKREHAERVQLVRRAERLSRGEEWTESFGEMTAIEASWEALGPVGEQSGDLGDRFQRARDRYHKRHQAHARAKARRAGKDRRGETSPHTATETTTETAPETTIETAPKTAIETAPETAIETAPETAIATTPETTAQETATEAATDAPPDTEAQSQGSPEMAPEAPSDAMDAAAQLEQEEQKRRQEERRQQQRERQERDLASLGELIQEMEARQRTNKRKQVEKTLQRADKTFDSLRLPDGSEDEVAKYNDLRQKLFIKAQELREAEDWQRWSNVPRQEALIEKARALLTAEDQSKLLEKLKALQNEWRRVGPVPHKRSQELWQAFKATCDQVYERVKVARARLVEEHAANLVRKRELCEKVEALAESTEWEETADAIKRLQREWRGIGPVPRKHSDAIWKRFRAACDSFFERRKPHLEELLAERQKHLEDKLALCDQAEKLSESTNWKEATSELRQLQRQWRNIGPVPRKDASAVNKRFRAACDSFFERRQKRRDEEKNARQQKRIELESEIATLIEMIPAEADLVQSVVEHTLAVRSALRELALTGSEARSVYERANELYRAVLAAHPEALRGTDLDPAISSQKKTKLLQRAEALAPPPIAAAPEAAEQSPELVAERLRAALAQNAMSSSLAQSTDGMTTADNIAELEQAWLRIGPVPGADGDDMETRFRSACDRVLGPKE